MPPGPAMSTPYATSPAARDRSEILIARTRYSYGYTQPNTPILYHGKAKTFVATFGSR